MATGAKIPSRALVLGANGQDGSYLAEALLTRGAAVWGIARQAESRWVRAPGYIHAAMDLRDEEALARLLREVDPHEIYHLAAVHGASGFAYEPVWRDALAVNVGVLHACLEHVRLSAPSTRVFYASSLKAFGKTPPQVIGSDTPRVSECLYSITKNAASDLIDYYRAEHGVRADIGFYFNHDSPRRPAHYFLPRLVAQLAHAISDPGGSEPLPLATLDFSCDWGSSAEFMDLTVDLLRSESASDCIFATGVAWRASDLADELSRRAGLASERWLRVRDQSDSNSGAQCRADLASLRGAVGRVPQADGLDVALWILRETHGIDLGEQGARRA
ncbi:MAG: GDP-mannose 4,6-dehydratase [Caulobacteraceae bacterium]